MICNCTVATQVGDFKSAFGRVAARVCVALLDDTTTSSTSTRVLCSIDVVKYHTCVLLDMCVRICFGSCRVGGSVPVPVPTPAPAPARPLCKHSTNTAAHRPGRTCVPTFQITSCAALSSSSSLAWHDMTRHDMSPTYDNPEAHELHASFALVELAQRDRLGACPKYHKGDSSTSPAQASAHRMACAVRSSILGGTATSMAQSSTTRLAHTTSSSTRPKV